MPYGTFKNTNLLRGPEDMIEACRNLSEISTRQEVIRRILSDWQTSQE